jgi:protein SCO1/2
VRALATGLLLTLAIATGPAQAHDEVPATLRDVGFDQRLDARVPLQAEFRDERGRPVTLAALLGGRPAVLSLNQYRCPHLCPFVLEGLAMVVRSTPLVLGRQYVIVTIGIDPREGPEVAASRKAALARGYLPAGAAADWHFLTGSEGAIRQVARAVGFRYTYDRAQDAYAHPTGVVVLTADGRVARYLFGMDYPARDLRLALVEAARGQIGSLTDRLLLACYHYDATTGRYTPTVMTVVRTAGALTVAGMGLFLFMLFRRDGSRRP